jgi:hypothetical protein
MRFVGDGILHLQPPVYWRLEGTSAWINMLTGAGERVLKGQR